jgi:hypothetical protein
MTKVGFRLGLTLYATTLENTSGVGQEQIRMNFNDGGNRCWPEYEPVKRSKPPGNAVAAESRVEQTSSE